MRPAACTGWRQLAACASSVVTLVALSGCETPTSQSTRSSDAGSSAGAGASPVARSSPAPTGGQQQGGNSVAGQAAGQVGSGRRSTTLATFEGDLLCTRLVAPFDLNDNFGELTSLVTDGTTRTITAWFDSITAASPSGGAANNRGNVRTNVRTSTSQANRAAAAARHNIPYDVRATALRMNWLPISAEVLYGQMQLDKMRDDLLDRESTAGRRLYPQADALLAEVLKAVTEPHGYNFQLHIRTASGDNAIALPGGFVLVDAELIRNPKLREKAYFAIGHEIGHVLQRHETRAVQARIIDTVSLGGNVYDLVKSIRSMRTDPAPLFAVVLAGKLQFERHFGDQEMHADGCSVRVLDRALDNNGRLVGIVQSFVNELAKMPATSGPTQAGSSGGGAAPGARQGAGTRSAPGAAPATAAQDKQGQMQVLVDVVSRPIDRHPGPRERAANLNNTLKDLREKSAQGAAGAAVSGAAGATTGATAVAPKDKGQTLTLPAATKRR